MIVQLIVATVATAVPATAAILDVERPTTLNNDDVDDDHEGSQYEHWQLFRHVQLEGNRNFAQILITTCSGKVEKLDKALRLSK